MKNWDWFATGLILNEKSTLAVRNGRRRRAETEVKVEGGRVVGEGGSEEVGGRKRKEKEVGDDEEEDEEEEEGGKR